MKKIFFETKDKLKLCGILEEPKTKTDKCVILAHGITVDKDEDGVFILLSNQLCKLGFAVFRFDFSAHGESKGQPIDMTITREVNDLEAAVKEIEKQYSKIALLGASFGGSISTFYVANNQEKINCLCLWNPVLNYDHTFINPTLPWIKERKAHMFKEIQEKGWTTLGSKKFIYGKALFDEMIKLKPFESLEKINIPTEIIHGDKDTKVPYEDSLKYSQKLTNGKLITIKNAEHGFHESWESKIAIEETINFLSNYFK
jgi:alpha-beta hydrolase superfamily lysophospholipase